MSNASGASAKKPNGNGVAGEGSRDGDSLATTLGAYFGQIGHMRVLTGPEEKEIARRFRGHRAAVHGILAGLPFTGAQLVSRWRASPGQGAPRGLLASREPTAAHTSELAETARRVERRLGRWGALGARTREDEATWDRWEARQRRDLLDLELSIDFYQDVEVALRERAARLEREEGGDARGHARRVREELGLPLRRLRRHLAELEPLVVARDEARNELTRHNLKLVVRFAKDFRNLGVPFTDLIQEANLGLLRAVELFDPERGLRFSTYAVWWIRQSLIRGIQKQARTVRLPSHVSDRVSQMGRVSDRLVSRLGRNPTASELGHETGLAPDRVDELRPLRKTPVSLDQAAHPDGTRALHEVLADPRAASEVDLVDSARDGDAVAAILGQLDANERAVIGRRFGLSGEEGVTLTQLAQDMGITTTRVRRIEEQALEKLRDWAASDGLGSLGAGDRASQEP